MTAPAAPRLVRGPCHQPLRVVAIGTVPPDVMERSAAVAREVLGFASYVSAQSVLPDPFIDPRRQQYRADRLLADIKGLVRQEHEVVLGLTSVDLFLPVLTFVFGCAELGGRAALMSVHRLDPRFSGFPNDPGVTLERAEKEVLHELGHVLGLTHCPDRACVMASAHDVGEIDVEEPSFCRGCRALIGPCPGGP
ncbi:MAG: archaemetzincin [Acidobacteria bacterium]|nr:archaemetzincin [Acidobacteriota bacterium]